VQGVLGLNARALGGNEVVAVGLVMTAISASSMTPRFMPCSSSPAPASRMSRKKSTMSGRRSGLAHADGFDEDVAITRGLAEQHGFAVRWATPPESRARETAG